MNDDKKPNILNIDNKIEEAPQGKWEKFFDDNLFIVLNKLMLMAVQAVLLVIFALLITPFIGILGCIEAYKIHIKGKTFFEIVSSLKTFLTSKN